MNARRSIPRRRAIAAVALPLLLPLLFPVVVGAQSAMLPPSAAALREAARAHRTAHEPAIVRELAGLLAIPNVAADSANIRRNAAALVAMLERRGVAARLLDGGGGPPAVYGELRAAGATRTVVFYAHYDGQPVDTTQWATEPWTPTLRDAALDRGGRPIPLPADGAAPLDDAARLYARSAGDDKASVIAMLAALDALKAGGFGPSVNVKFFFDGEEEAGSPHLRGTLERNRTLLAADAWIFGDGPNHQSGRQQVLFGVRGFAGLDLTVYGPTRPLHSGHYGNWAPNPAAMLAHVLASLRDDSGRITVAGFYDDVRPISAAERRAVRSLPPVDSTLAHSLGIAHPEGGGALLAELVMRPALNVRGIRVGSVGAQAANVISSEARASIDFRLVPGQTPARVRDLVNAHLRRLGYWVTADSATDATRLAHARVIRAAWDAGAYPASRAPMDGPLARAVVLAVGDGAGAAPLVVPTMGGSGPHYLFEQVLGVPVVTLPIANYDDNQHAANENLRMLELRRGIDVYVGLLGRLGTYWAGTVQ